ncbi:MAG: type II secretion system protein GspD, partial [Candidatus Ratteibacteria bacterium]
SIECFFIEIDTDALKDIGAKFKFIQSGYEGEGGIKIDSQTGDIIPPSSGFSGISIGYSDIIGTQLITEIKALEEEKRASILSNPRIVVVENQEAYILVGERYPILETTVTPGTTPILIESLRNYEAIGISLYVICKIVGKDEINLIIHPEVSEIGDDVVGSTGVKYKRINVREVDTEINIKSGNVVIIGGLLRKQKSNVINKIPLLGDIPILGYLFRKDTKIEKNKELLIFIIPKIKMEDEKEKLEEKIKKFSD